ncbi:hypothetical protein GCM10023172_16830 [Hymenobacter ginsengisoli]|uniref:Uncharacterized protein n=1 Tax=Hymenobacter ginsengisoli TaxID=1051626 RepID=A0ABP8QB16_9BACT
MPAGVYASPNQAVYYKSRLKSYATGPAIEKGDPPGGRPAPISSRALLLLVGLGVFLVGGQVCVVGYVEVVIGKRCPGAWY